MNEPEHEEAPDESVTISPVVDDVEAEEEEHEAEEETHEPAEAFQPPVDAAKEQRRLAAALKREQEAHSRKLEKVLGEAHEHVLLCPLCGEGLQGYVFPGDGQMLDDEQKGAVLTFIGSEIPLELQAAEGVVMCDRCDGWGELKYPSRKQLLATQPCPACNGNGYKLDVLPQSNVAHLPEFGAAPSPPPYGEVAACALCGAPNSAGKPHFCNPAQASGG